MLMTCLRMYAVLEILTLSQLLYVGKNLRTTYRWRKRGRRVGDRAEER